MSVWLQAFLLTLAIEVPLALVCLRPARRPRIVAAGIAATSLTHPILWFVWLPNAPGSFVMRALVGESLVILVEAVVYALALRVRPAHALAAAAICNAASYLVGLAIVDG